MSQWIFSAKGISIEFKISPDKEILAQENQLEWRRSGWGRVAIILGACDLIKLRSYPSRYQSYSSISIS